MWRSEGVRYFLHSDITSMWYAYINIKIFLDGIRLVASNRNIAIAHLCLFANHSTYNRLTRFAPDTMAQIELLFVINNAAIAVTDFRRQICCDKEPLGIINLPSVNIMALEIYWSIVALIVDDSQSMHIYRYAYRWLCVYGMLSARARESLDNNGDVIITVELYM